MDVVEISRKEIAIPEEYFKELEEDCTYGSLGTLNATIDTLEILKDRLLSGQIITYKGERLFMGEFERIIIDNFPTYVYKGLFKDRNLNHKVYFKLENTPEGMDLVYTGQDENKLFKWIADINKEQSLLRILPTNVVYIRTINKQGLTISPFVTEHNSCYVYDEDSGKIKEWIE
jgi:hypothetical protein